MFELQTPILVPDVAGTRANTDDHKEYKTRRRHTNVDGASAVTNYNGPAELAGNDGARTADYAPAVTRCRPRAYRCGSTSDRRTLVSG